MTIDEIRKMPTVMNNHHESLLRAYQTLEKVKDMLKRKDSSETILEVIEHVELKPNH